MATRPEHMRPGEVRQRAVAGVAMLLFRRVTLRAIGIAGALVLARLLEPRDFGVLALGVSVVSVADFVISGGLGVGLIRRVEEPSDSDLKAVQAFELIVAFVIGVPVAAVALAVSREVGTVTALMMASLPIAAISTPAAVVTERALRYRPVLIAGLWSTTCYWLFAIGAVLAGLGVVGVAAAWIVRVVVGSTLLLAMVPAGRVMPEMDWRRVRGLLAFASQFHADRLITMLRAQGLNFGLVAVGGLATVGLWNVAWRILQIPFLLWGSMRRVAFPAMSRLHTAGEDLGPVLMRTTGLIAVPVGALLVGVVAAGYALIPVLLGEQWRPVSGVTLWASPVLALTIPVATVAGVFLYVADTARKPLTAIASGALTWVVLGLALVPTLGVTGVGVGFAVGSLLEAVMFARGVHRRAHVNLFASVIVPAAIAIAAALAGLGVSAALGHDVVGGVSGGVVGEAVYLVLLMCIRPRLLADALRVGRRGFTLARQEA